MILSYLNGLRALFLPDSINGYYIAPEKLVGLEIQPQAIFATTVSVSGHKKTITGCFQQDIAQDELIPADERIVDALKKISTLIGDYDELIVSLPNNLIIFKEITIPFTDSNTIKMVVPFEVEPLLPFTLNEAFIDVLPIHSEKDKTTVQVAALKKSTVESYRALLQAAGLKPTKFSAHLFEFYAVFKEIPEYHTDNTPTLCIEILPDSRQFMGVVDGELRNIRIIPRGNVDSRFIQDVQFTLDSFNNQLPADKKIKRILVASPLLEIKNLITQIHEATGLQTEEFLLYKVVHNNTIKATNSVLLTTPYIAAIGAGLDLSYTREINFLQQDFEPHDDALLLRQAITTGIVLCAIFVPLVFFTQRAQHALKKEIAASAQEAKTKLAQELHLSSAQSKGDLKSVIKTAQAYSAKQEEIWFALSSQNRYSFLHYLQELFRRLDPQALGLSLTMLSINDAANTMTVEGEVKGWEELSKLDQELSRPNTLFTLVNRPQQPKFSIKIAFDKDYKEN